jgi:hypothetical protein
MFRQATRSGQMSGRHRRLCGRSPDHTEVTRSRIAGKRFVSDAAKEHHDYSASLQRRTLFKARNAYRASSSASFSSSVPPL